MKDDLNQQLRQWKVAPRIPSGFQREVWARIAIQQSVPKNFWARFMEWLVMPRYATAAFVIVVFSSVLLGLANANTSNQQAWENVQARYALSLNPITHMASR